MFPRKNSRKLLFAIAATSGLPSSLRDAHAWIDKYTKAEFETYLVIDGNAEKVTSKVKTTVITLDDIPVILNKIGKEIPHDIIISISGHGYSPGYFIFSGRRIDKKTIRKWFRGIENSVHKIFLFIDTCHSANIPGFQSDEIGNVTAVAGCRNSQSLMQDISSDYGYGGGLTSAFMDNVSEDGSFDIVELNKKLCARIIKLGAHVTISSAVGF